MNYLRSIAAVIVFVFYFQCLSAQSNYISHTLKQGESLSMLAQKYNSTVGDIMRANGMHADSKLVYGSKIKIPSTKKQADVAVKSSAIVNTPPPATASSSGELTHIVAKGETLYGISKKYNVTLAQLRTWNNLVDDNVKLGTLLIVNESGVNRMATTNAQKQKAETVPATQPQKEPAVESKPAAASTETVKTDNAFQPALPTENNVSSAATADVTNYSGEGFFATQFKEGKSKNNVSGISKTFKTASGWTDGKFYILANNIEPGTIVKITADNSTSVYAKVLWNMGDLKDNAGIDFRVSNATAAALHINEPSFNVNVSF